MSYVKKSQLFKKNIKLRIEVAKDAADRIACGVPEDIVELCAGYSYLYLICIGRMARNLMLNYFLRHGNNVCYLNTFLNTLAMF